MTAVNHIFDQLIAGIGSKEPHFRIPRPLILSDTHFHTVPMTTIFGSILWMTHVNHIFDPLIIGICSKEPHFRIPRPRNLSYTHFHSDPTTPILDQIWDFPYDVTPHTFLLNTLDPFHNTVTPSQTRVEALRNIVTSLLGHVTVISHLLNFPAKMRQN